jgi:hypothetical protein
MNIKIKFPLDLNGYTDARLPSLGLLVFVISFGIQSLDIQFENFRESIFLPNRSHKTLADYGSLCNISYDDCRCSVLFNKSENSSKCITDVAAMTGHILPLVSYALQLYLIYELFSFTGKYSHILTDIFWIAALLVFVFIAIGVHGSSCLHRDTSYIILLTGMLIFGFVMYLTLNSDSEYPSRRHGTTYLDQRVATNNDDDKTMIIVVAS